MQTAPTSTQPPATTASADAAAIADIITAAQFPALLQRKIVDNLLSTYLPSPSDNMDRSAAPTEPGAYLANLALQQAGSRLRLDSCAPGSNGAALQLIDVRSGARTEYGCLVCHPGRDLGHDAPGDWNAVLAVLANLAFLEGLFYKVRRLSIVFDDGLYPFWIPGRRGLRQRPGERPELAVHYRYLENLTPAREARLYRSVTPRWEIRHDRVQGDRTWPRSRFVGLPDADFGFAPRTSRLRKSVRRGFCFARRLLHRRRPTS